MTLPWITTVCEHVDRWAERQVAGRFPFASITLWALFVAFVLTTFPNYPRLLYDQAYDREQCSWSAIAEKRDDLFKDMLTTHEAGSHDAKLTFRILVPAVARILGLGKLGIFVLQSLCGVALLWAVGRIAHRATGDLVSALFVTCGVASTWAGTTAFIELRGMFDGEALLLVALSALLETPWLTAAAVFLCGWTDERGLVATSLVYLYHVNRRHRRGHGGIASFFGATPLSVVIGWAGYVASRLAIIRIYGIATDTAGVSPRVALIQFNNLPAGAWTALEGGWLLVLAAVVILARRRRPVFLAMYLGAIAILVATSMCVYDITRSMAYLLPSLFVALDVLGEVESVPDLRVLCGTSSLVSILSPNYYVSLRYMILWNVPLPVRLLSWAAGE
jgi:hypothetical protein